MKSTLFKFLNIKFAFFLNISWSTASIKQSNCLRPCGNLNDFTLKISLISFLSNKDQKLLHSFCFFNSLTKGIIGERILTFKLPL